MGRLLRLDPGFADDVPFVLDFLGVPDPAHPVPDMSPETRSGRIVHFMERLSETRGPQEPLVALWEDIHWIDSASEAVLTKLAENRSARRILALHTSRPGYRAPWHQCNLFRGYRRCDVATGRYQHTD